MVWSTSKAKKLPKKQPKYFMELLRSYFHIYCEMSTIHGVRYLYDSSISSIERLIWTALVITSVVSTGIAYGMLAERYGAKRLETVVEDSQFPIVNVPFPAVGVCMTNRINWAKLEEAKEEFLPIDADKNMTDLFTMFVANMETMKFGGFERFMEIEGMNLEMLDFLDVTKLANFFAFKCEDIFVSDNCRFRSKMFDCCEGFLMEKTEAGLCLVFNSLTALNSSKIKERIKQGFYPQHNAKAGQGTGLNMQINLNKKLVRPNSVFDSLLNESNLTTNGLEYRRTNCLAICHEEHMIEFCNCTLPLFFHKNHKNIPQCKPTNFRCLAKNVEIFQYDKSKEEAAFFGASKAGMLCSCRIACNSLNFYTALTTLPLPLDLIPNNSDTLTFKIDVHYQTDVIIKYRTSLEFTILDLISNFGGIFGLCMGASMVSAVELVYHATIGFSLYLFDNDYWNVFKQNLKELKLRLKQQFKNSIAQEQQQQQQTSKVRSMRKRSVW